MLKELGVSIGEEVVLIGFDDIELCGFVEPALTSVSIPLAEIGQRAAEKLIALAGGQACRHREELPCRIVERETFVYED